MGNGTDTHFEISAAARCAPTAPPSHAPTRALPGHFPRAPPVIPAPASPPGASWLRRGAGLPSPSRRPGRTTLNRSSLSFPAAEPRGAGLLLDVSVLGEEIWRHLHRQLGQPSGIFILVVWCSGFLRKEGVSPRAGSIPTRYHLRLGLPHPLLILGSSWPGTRRCCLLRARS